MIAVKEPVLAKTRLFEPADFNCYDYYIMNTEKYGEYAVFQHYGRDHMKSELVNDIEALACYVKYELGLKPGDCFTVFMPTSAESMMIYMAMNKLGVIVNFVHPLIPPESLRETMVETKSKGIAVLDVLAPKIAETIGSLGVACVLCVTATYAVEDKYSVKASDEAVRAVSSAVKHFTVFPEIIKKYNGQKTDGVKHNAAAVAVYMNGGGTTGKSKTIKLSNSALNNIVYMLCSANTPTENVGVDTELCCMPFFHAFGLCAGCLSAINKGAKACFLAKFDAGQFINLMKINNVVEFNGVPNMFKKLLITPGFDGPHLKNIKALFSGGDDLSPAFLRDFDAVLRKNGSESEIYQGYGLTECCAVCTNNRPWANRRGSIGQPLPGLRLEIWDENNRKVPNGTVGQIVVTGPTRMIGYLTEDGPEDEGLYTDAQGDKWVLTGDLGKYDDDGYVYFVGRIKRVIIISGYNVYPGDIEKLLIELSFIRECCAVQGYVGEKPIVRLYAAVTDGDRERYKREITELCSERLSKLCVPKEIVFIDELPRTRLQKVDFMKLTQKKPS